MFHASTRQVQGDAHRKSKRELQEPSASGRRSSGCPTLGRTCPGPAGEPQVLAPPPSWGWQAVLEGKVVSCPSCTWWVEMAVLLWADVSVASARTAGGQGWCGSGM